MGGNWLSATRCLRCGPRMFFLLAAHPMWFQKSSCQRSGDSWM